MIVKMPKVKTWVLLQAQLTSLKEEQTAVGDRFKKSALQNHITISVVQLQLITIQLLSGLLETPPILPISPKLILIVPALFLFSKDRAVTGKKLKSLLPIKEVL